LQAPKTNSPMPNIAGTKTIKIKAKNATIYPLR